MKMRTMLLCCSVALAMTTPPVGAITHSIEVSRLTSDSTLRRGPNTGPRFNPSCPEGTVLIGIDFHAGGVIDNVVGRCSAITANGNWKVPRRPSAYGCGRWSGRHRDCATVPGESRVERVSRPGGRRDRSFDPRMSSTRAKRDVRYVDAVHAECGRWHGWNRVRHESVNRPARAGRAVLPRYSCTPFELTRETTTVAHRRADRCESGRRHEHPEVQHRRRSIPA